MAHELAVVGGEDTAVSLWRKPEQVLAEATEAAKALVKVVSLKKNKVVFNGETYLEFEDWQTVSKFYGCTTKIISTNPVEFDGVRGFEATAVVLDRNQNEIGRVDSMCLSDEENWGDVPKYEWIDVLDANGKKIWDENAFKGKGGYKREKKEVSRAPKPLFQLRSMAQTRAQVKALRSIFSWVVVMAGYQPTPAEELTGNEFPPEDDPEPKKPVSMPEATKAQPKFEKFDAVGTIASRGGFAKDGALWVSIGDNLLAIPADKLGSHPYGVGDKLVFTAIEKQGKEKKFWILQMLDGYTAAPAGPAGDVLPPEKPDEMDKAIASGQLSYEDVEKEPIGTLEETRQGTLGRKREIAIYAMITNNKDRNNGLNQENMHKVLNAMVPPVAHVRDLRNDMWEQFKQIAKGEVDWRDLV